MRKFTVLGSTGSIGTQTLEIIRADQELTAVALAAFKNIEKLHEQILEFHPELVCVYDVQKAALLKSRLQQEGIRNVRVVSGMDGLMETAACESADTAVIAVVGMIGIRPTIAAIEAGKKIALANKETLVAAGHLIMPMVKKYGINLIPVDSEHSAIYQCLVGEQKEAIEKILLTASGGPFRGWTKEMLKNVRPEDALKHPNWSMGAKITIDSASLINKALEVMEAHWLFSVDYEKIEVLVQPRSVVHSMVQFTDGSVKAQLGVPSMLLPIAYALYETERHPIPSEERLDFAKIRNIAFEAPDTEVFPGLSLGIEAGKTGGTAPVVFNAANEEAVGLFLQGEIGFCEIPESIEKVLSAHSVQKDPGLTEIFEAEQEARQRIREVIRKRSIC